MATTGSHVRGSLRGGIAQVVNMNAPPCGPHAARLRRNCASSATGRRPDDPRADSSQTRAGRGSSGTLVAVRWRHPDGEVPELSVSVAADRPRRTVRVRVRALPNDGVQLTQTVGRLKITAEGEGQFVCDGTTQPWAVDVLSSNGKFGGGKAAVFAYANACAGSGCGFDSAERVVTLRK